MSDEYEGQGGSYKLNPKTGKRTLIERTGMTETQTIPEPTQNDSVDTPVDTKEPA